MSESQFTIISSRSTGGFTLAQQVSVDENGKKTNVFLKNSYHIDNIEGLENLRDALNVAIEKSKN